MGTEVGTYTMVWGHRLRYRIASGVGTGCLTEVCGILPTADSDIASGRDLNREAVSHEVLPIADRRHRVTLGHELCAISGVHVTLLIADSDIASAETNVPLICFFMPLRYAILRSLYRNDKRLFYLTKNGFLKGFLYNVFKWFADLFSNNEVLIQINF